MRSYLLFLVSFLPAVALADKVMFELFDNGASSGGVQVIYDSSEFPSGDHAAQLFALDLSTRGILNVTKFAHEEGTVKAHKAFREDGELIEKFEQLLPGTNEANRRIYLVAEGLEFVWPFVYAGYQQIVSPNAITAPESDNDAPIILESVSDSPRVFKVYNFFSMDESQALIDNALSLTGDKKLKRSTVGNKKGAENDGASVDHGRTSENAWDSSSPAAKTMIQRSFNLTGVPYDAGKVDGLQIVRYNVGEFYNTHPDYFSSRSDPDFDFNPYSGGSNRFATVFMYINDVEEGGCTVFPKVDSPNPTEPSQEEQALFDKGSLEYSMLWNCHTKLAVPPKQGTAALFYSVTPDGRVDPMAYHGACPVTKGVKWGANIWIWNRQRYGEIKTGERRTMSVTNNLAEPIYITWENKPNGVLAPGQNVKFDTFEFHRFKALTKHHKGQTHDEFTVQTDPMHQAWVINPKPILTVGESSSSRINMGAGSEL